MGGQEKQGEQEEQEEQEQQTYPTLFLGIKKDTREQVGGNVAEDKKSRVLFRECLCLADSVLLPIIP